MIIRLIKYIKGYVKIRVEGYAQERFLNLCGNHHILLWDIKNLGDCFELYISINGFRQLKPILKKTKTKLTVLERHGLPFFLHKYRKRKIFFIGIILCMTILYVLSQFIWQIELEGNYSRTTDVILDYLKDMQVYHGMKKKDVDCETIEEELRSEFNDIIWASARIEGTRLIISVKENTDLDFTKEQSLEASDIVANKAGTINSIITREGTPMVHEGQEIKEGDMLVSGKIPIYNDAAEIINYQYCVADSDILLNTSYTYTDSFPLAYESKEYTGNAKKSYFVTLLDQSFTFPKRKPEFENYSAGSTENQLKLGKNFYLPFFYGKITYNEYVVKNKTYTKQQAISIAQNNLKNFCEDLEEKGVQITKNNVNINVTGKNCVANGTIQVIEAIGKRVPTEIVELPKENDTEKGISEE